MVLRSLIVLDSLGGGGTEASTAELVPEYTRHGVLPFVVSLKRVDVGVEERLRAAGVSSLTLEGNPARQIAQLRSLIRRFEPDVVHTSLFKADLVGRVAAAFARPVLTSLVNLTYDPSRLMDPRVRPWKLGLAQALDRASARSLTAHFHAVTVGVKDAYIQTFGLREQLVTVVERGRARAHWSPRLAGERSSARTKLGLSEDELIFINVGRHEYQKNQAALVRAFSALPEGQRATRLVVLGREGNATREINEAIRSLQVNSRVTLAGYTDAVRDWLIAADVFVFPSLFEGAGGAAIEAMASGLPVITTPTLSEVVGGSGIIVGADDERGLRDAMAHLAGTETERERLGAEGRRIFEHRYSLEVSAARMCALYESVARVPPRPFKVRRAWS